MANSGGYPFQDQKNDFFNQGVLLEMACFEQLSKNDKNELHDIPWILFDMF